MIGDMFSKNVRDYYKNYIGGIRIQIKTNHVTYKLIFEYAKTNSSNDTELL